MRLERIFDVCAILGFYVLLTSCGAGSSFKSVQKSGDWRLKYEVALDYYDKENYYRALLLLEDILPIVKTEKEGEMASFYYAYCHYNYKDQYILAAHYFKQFYQTYSRSPYAEEAMYMHAMSLYQDSPDYNLDQTSTEEAVVALQVFLNRYPGSTYSKQADQLIRELRVKLELKAYETSKQYHRMGSYKAAVVAFQNFEDDFPDSKFNEEIRFLKIDAQVNLAKYSISSKQKERYLEALGFYEEFIDTYPKSKYISQAEGLYTDARRQLRSEKEEIEALKKELEQ